MDTNHTCQLEIDELMEAVASAGLIHITARDCQQMIKEINMTGTSTIFYTEFIAATLNLKKILSQYQDDSLIFALFKDFDHQDIDVLTV